MNAPTKSELAAQVAALQTENEALKAETIQRAADAAAVEAERDELREAVVKIDSTLGDLLTLIEAAAIEESIAEGITQDVLDEINHHAKSLFDRVMFATATLASVAAYGGDDLDVARNLARVALGDLAPFIEASVATGFYDNIYSSALTVVVAEDVVEEGDPDATECGPECACQAAADVAEAF